jgi:hypothetical protein
MWALFLSFPLICAHMIKMTGIVTEKVPHMLSLKKKTMNENAMR